MSASSTGNSGGKKPHSPDAVHVCDRGRDGICRHDEISADHSGIRPDREQTFGQLGGIQINKGCRIRTRQPDTQAGRKDEG
jgi:hypothetical protein